VRRGGAAEGSLGRPELDRAAADAALGALGARRRAVAELAGGVGVFLDPLEGEARVVICGAGHIAVPLARLCRDAGFAVTVLDDRPDFANEARFPGCRVLAEPFVPALAGLDLGPSTYAVVITRGHEHDAECLAQVLRRETAYVGLIGSRRRVRFVLEMLGREGIARERLEQVFTPIGLPIGAESPDEIALSIAAELVCVRRKGAAQARALRAAAGGAP
ncbi:MAG: XdhC family protein, partial [Deferrisomatales bacterium]